MIGDNPADIYALEVVEGRVPAGKYHRLACRRHLQDRRRECSRGFPYEFKWDLAENFLNFCRTLKHYKGRQFAGRPFEPEPFQVFVLGSIFGWRHVGSGLRRFTTAYLELPRKSGKSFLAAVVALYATFFENEAGAEGYCLATKEAQARIVFDACKQLVTASGLSARVKVSARTLSRAATAQKLEPLGSDSDTTDGLNPHVVVVDELHAWRTRGLLDVMESATGARVNPLFLQITTAGDDPVSPCGDQHDYACRILDGTLTDDPATVATFACLAHADPDDDPWDEAIWIKANPMWGVSVNPDDLRKLAAKAKQIPAAAAEFQQKRLNLWVNASAPCLSVEGWRKGQSSGRPGWDVPALHGEPCYVGIDLAAKLDLCALVLVFPPTQGRASWRWVPMVWTPADTLADRAHRDRAPYRVWADQGWLQAVPGTRINPQVVLDAILEARDRYDLQMVGFDPWHAGDLMAALVADHGFSAEAVVEVPQTFQGLSAACLQVQGDTLAGLIDAGGDPVTGWCVSNVVANRDGKDNLIFTKGKSRGRIDPVIAGTIATACHLRRPVEAAVEVAAWLI